MLILLVLVLDIDWCQWCQIFGTRTCIYPISFNNMIFTVSAIDPSSSVDAAQFVQLRNFKDSLYTSFSQLTYYEGNRIGIIDINYTEGLFILIGY